MYEEIEQLIKPYKEKISPELLANPQFMREMNQSLSWIKESSGSDSATLNVSEDGKSVSISKTYRSQNPNEALKNNQEMFVGRVYLTSNENGTMMESEKSVGTFFDAKAYIPFASSEEDKRLLSERNVDVQSSFYYAHSVIDSEGIYLSRSSASDTYPLTGTYVGDERNLKNQLLSNLHKPTFTFGSLPKAPIYTNKMQASTSYRFYNSLGLVESVSQTYLPRGEVANVKYSVDGLHTEYPELMGTVGPIGNLVQGKVTSTYPEFDGISHQELARRYAEIFKSGVEHSRTKDYDRKMYEALMRRANQGIEAYNQPKLESDGVSR